MKQNSRENIYSLTGFGKVFRFTLVQTLKNKGLMASAIIMILMMAFMKPMMYLFSKSGGGVATAMTASLRDIDADTMCVYNGTQVPISLADLVTDPGTPEDKGLKPANISFVEYGAIQENDLIKDLGPKDILIIIRMEQKGYKVNGIISDDSEVDVRSLDKATEYVQQIFEEVRKKNMGLDDEALKALASGVNTDGVMTEADYKLEQEKTMGRGEYSGIMIAFVMIVLIVSSLASSYIVASVNEEKSSKLAESLLVSVRPMALLMGKIIAMLTFIFGTILIGVSLSMVVEKVMVSAFNVDFGAVAQNNSFNMAIFTGYGVKGFIVLVVELMLALCSFGVLSGILGSACSQTEDQQSATTVVMMLAMIGYMAGMYGGMNDNMIVVLSLVPPVSYFTAPVAYIGGRIGIEILLASFVIQAVVLVALVILAAKTYRVLLLSDSSRPKLASILAATKG